MEGRDSLAPRAAACPPTNLGDGGQVHVVMGHGIVDEVIDLARVLRLGNQPGSVDEDAHRGAVACTPASQALVLLQF